MKNYIYLNLLLLTFISSTQAVDFALNKDKCYQSVNTEYRNLTELFNNGKSNVFWSKYPELKNPFEKLQKKLGNIQKIMLENSNKTIENMDNLENILSLISEAKNFYKNTSETIKLPSDHDEMFNITNKIRKYHKEITYVFELSQVACYRCNDTESMYDKVENDHTEVLKIYNNLTNELKVKNESIGNLNKKINKNKKDAIKNFEHLNRKHFPFFLTFDGDDKISSSLKYLKENQMLLEKLLNDYNEQIDNLHSKVEKLKISAEILKKLDSYRNITSQDIKSYEFIVQDSDKDLIEELDQVLKEITRNIGDFEKEQSELTKKVKENLDYIESNNVFLEDVSKLFTTLQKVVENKDSIAEEIEKAKLTQQLYFERDELKKEVERLMIIHNELKNNYSAVHGFCTKHINPS